VSSILGTNVIAPIVPFDTTDIHPSHCAAYGLGGYRSVATLRDRDSIPLPRREVGMLVYVASAGYIFYLNADLSTWIALDPSITDGGSY